MKSAPKGTFRGKPFPLIYVCDMDVGFQATERVRGNSVPDDALLRPIWGISIPTPTYYQNCKIWRAAADGRSSEATALLDEAKACRRNDGGEWAVFRRKVTPFLDLDEVKTQVSPRKGKGRANLETGGKSSGEGMTKEKGRGNGNGNGNGKGKGKGKERGE